ncbi:MAG TPA: SLBB domain-containing protein [Gemmatimonadales bacterium]|nr:SLBB domain-containing protein [Gemmatimonadales bacterium]
MNQRSIRWLAIVGALLLLRAVPAAAQDNLATPFQVGDRILLSVEGDSALSDTFSVVAGPALRLPKIGDISLANVSRSGLEPYLTRELGRYINDPVVSARALIRISVMGEVARPGFYAVPVDLVLPDALMVAGGATTEARLERLQILRGNSAVVGSAALQSAIARGSTLDQLGIQAGDRILVPKQRDPESKWRIAGIIVTGIAAAVTVTALSR